MLLMLCDRCCVEIKPDSRFLHSVSALSDTSVLRWWHWARFTKSYVLSLKEKTICILLNLTFHSKTERRLGGGFMKVSVETCHHRSNAWIQVFHDTWYMRHGPYQNKSRQSIDGTSSKQSLNSSTWIIPIFNGLCPFETLLSSELDRFQLLSFNSDKMEKGTKKRRKDKKSTRGIFCPSFKF